MPMSIEELKKIPYLDVAVIQGRTVKLMPLWDGTRWRMWTDTEIGIIEMQVVDALESDYVATKPAKETDLFIPFVHLMWQHASYPEITPLIVAISDDFHNMGTSVAKLKHFWKFQEHIERGGAVRFASTELEYLVALCRTVFDLLQEIISRLWASTVRLTDDEAEAFRKSHSLPKTFSKMVLDNKENPRDAAQIASKFGLPSSLSEQYAFAAPFFAQLRKVRDKVIHGGSGFRSVYETERGFCINPKEAPYNDFEGWLPHHQYNENISSVLPWIADVVMKTIDVCNGLMGRFAQTIAFPPALAPGYFVFVRGPHNNALASLLNVYSGQTGFWDRKVELDSSV
jgi:hypothetical protein